MSDSSHPSIFCNQTMPWLRNQLLVRPAPTVRHSGERCQLIYQA